MNYPVSQLIRLFAFAAVFSGIARAAELIYLKNRELLVAYDFNNSRPDGVMLDRGVDSFIKEDGMVVYLKGQSLYLIRNTREPEIELIDRHVVNVEFRDGIIAWVAGNHLYVFKIKSDMDKPTRVDRSLNTHTIEIADGLVIFFKNANTAYRVTDLESGAVERMRLP